MWLTQYAVPAKASIALLLCSVATLCFDSPVYPADSSPARHAKVSSRLRSAAIHEKLKVWALFEDKGISTETQLQTALGVYERRMSARAKRRRLRRTDLAFPDITDLPVPSRYIDAALEVGGHLRAKSRWLNAISLEATPAEIEKIARLPFVRAIDPIEVYRSTVQRSDSSRRFSPRRFSPRRDAEIAPTVQEAPPGLAPLDYGNSRTQIEQIQADFLHESGFRGEGAVIGLLDTGFNLDHIALQGVDVLARYDFVNDDNNPVDEIGQDDPGEDDHGSVVLGILAGNAPGVLMGVAYRASYLLAKTEKAVQNGQEFERLIEEDWWIEGLEWAEEMGAEIIGSSLGYSKWYRFKDLDGKTSKLTIAANLAVEKGMSVIVAAGKPGGAAVRRFRFGRAH